MRLCLRGISDVALQSLKPDNGEGDTLLCCQSPVLTAKQIHGKELSPPVVRNRPVARSLGGLGQCPVRPWRLRVFLPVHKAGNHLVCHLHKSIGV